MEITANALQTVNENQNVLFTDTVTCGNCSITHRDGSGLVTLRGLTNQCRARFKVSFGGNIGIPTGGTVEAISIAISLDGEAVATTNLNDGDMILLVTDGISDAFNNSGAIIDYLRTLPAKNPQALADDVLHYAVELNNGEIKDDMTALAVRIYKKAS